MNTKNNKYYFCYELTFFLSVPLRFLNFNKLCVNKIIDENSGHFYGSQTVSVDFNYRCGSLLYVIRWVIEKWIVTYHCGFLTFWGVNMLFMRVLNGLRLIVKFNVQIKPQKLHLFPLNTLCSAVLCVVYFQYIFPIYISNIHSRTLIKRILTSWNVGER